MLISMDKGKENGIMKRMKRFLKFMTFTPARRGKL